MIVGAALLELHVHGSQSLKAKRGVVKSITARVRNRFNVAVAEVGGQDTWQRCVLGVTTCGTDPKKVRRALTKFDDWVVLVLSVLPLITGYVAVNRVFGVDATLWMGIHILSAELLMIAFPFTKLMHAVTLL